MSPKRLLFLTLTLVGVFEIVRAQTCGSTQCPASYFDPDLTLSPKKDCYDIDDSVGLSCAGDLGGPPINFCLNEGWQFPPSTCEVFLCSKPTVGDSLNVIPDQDTYIARDTITYTCDQGHTLTGTTTAICDAEETWNPATVPICIASCEPPNILNGNLTTNGPFNDGDSAQVNCYEGSDLEAGASSTITCQADGTWDSVPSCFSRCNVAGVPNSDSETPSNVNHDASKTIFCDADYSYEQETSFTLTCSDGVLGGVLPDQCHSDCIPPLAAPANGVITGGNLHGESIEFSCNRGYGTNDTTADTCTDGSWDNGGNIPTCYELSLEDSITLYCNPDKFIVEIPGALIGPAVGVSSVTLGTCEGSYYDGVYLYANSSYTECGTTSEVNDLIGQIIYRNTVTSVPAAISGIITTEESLTINVACVFDQDNVVSSSAVVQNTLSKDLYENGQFEMVFAAYTDDSYKNEITGEDTVNTNDVIYLRAEVHFIARIDVFPLRCYATPEPESSHFRFYDLIDEGCPVDALVSNLRTDVSTDQNFAFEMNVFRFTDSESNSIYIHCELKICPVDQYECPLPENCAALRRKRATQISFSRHVSAGPIQIRHANTADENSSGEWQSTSLAIYSATVTGLLLSVMVIISVMIYRRRSDTVEYIRPGNI